MKTKRTLWVSVWVPLLLSFFTVSGRAQESAQAGETAEIGSWLGDAGHFIKLPQRMFARNPDGRAFTITVHRHVWEAADGLNDPDYPIHVLAPDGTQAATATLQGGEGSVTVSVPAGAAGVYELEVKATGYSLLWVESSLHQMVAESQNWQEGARSKQFELHVVAPRRWYFYVPLGTRRFQVRHVVLQTQTHREDYGFFVVNPRGQRVEALFGGKPLDMSPSSGTREGFSKRLAPVPITRTVEVDPGTDGRFWSVWLTNGDSHNYSDLTVMLEGVPPYFATAPEHWFDPSSGQNAPGLVYDDTVIRQPDTVDAQGNVGDPYPRYYCTPTAFLGDEDYNGWRGPHTLWVSNPDNRSIEFGVQTYLSAPAERKATVTVRITGPKGKALLEQALPLGTSLRIPAAGAGVYRVECDGRRWFPWTHPAPPIVIRGQPTTGGGAHFALETGTVRHWYFKVPAGTRQFTVAAQVLDPNHVLRIEVQAPDRIQEEIALRGGARREIAVTVDPRLADHIWFLRTEVGSASRMLSGRGNPRQVNIEADLELHGVPGFLAPTWEQSFEPE
ncbi:MAG: hypothetical protein O2901_00560 [Verrucomicrobia bacterium]|nr:hypothetical protein [Verrucomicrobiota bacterium]